MSSNLPPGVTQYMIDQRFGRDDDPKRNREEPVEAAYKCWDCGNPWVVFAFEGIPDSDDHRTCRYCESDRPARRIR